MMVECTKGSMNKWQICQSTRFTAYVLQVSKCTFSCLILPTEVFSTKLKYKGQFKVTTKVFNTKLKYKGQFRVTTKVFNTKLKYKGQFKVTTKVFNTKLKYKGQFKVTTKVFNTKLKYKGQFKVTTKEILLREIQRTRSAYKKHISTIHSNCKPQKCSKKELPYFSIDNALVIYTKKV